MRCSRCSADVAGHRFCSQCGLPVAQPEAAGADQRADNRADNAEFRHLSVVFSDLEDSARLTAQLGAESFRELLRDYREVGAQIFGKYGGHVARYFGDGTMVYFGYPVVHEDNARRAVHAAFELLGALRRQASAFGARWKVDVRARVAVHTGMVVVGDLRSATASEELAIVGDAPNIAARLQALAEAGTVLISGATHELVRQDFACTALGPRALKGVALPVLTYRVDELLAMRGRTDARPRRGEMVGREAEARVLAVAWEQALAGHGGVVLVQGEPGIGKSRLIGDAVGRAEWTGARQAVLQCSSIYQNTALYPVIDYMTAVFGLEPEQTELERAARIRAAVEARALDVAVYVPVFASLLGVAAPGEEREAAEAVPMSPARRREYVMRRICDWVTHAAALTPLLLIVEDLHWADPTTMELLAELSARVRGTRVLMVLSSRDVFDRRLAGAQGARLIELKRLEPEDAMAMIRALARFRPLSRATLELLSAKTDGMPFYIEEMTRAVVEADADFAVVSGMVAVSGTEATLAVPATLLQSLAARIGRAAVSRDLLEIIAALGREFDLDLLSALWPHDGAALRDDLERLVAARLLRATHAGRERYMFCHALIQETIYGSLLASRRRDIHAQVARTLAAKFARAAEERPELVAHHFLCADEGLAALPYLRQAASMASQRSAHAEARHSLRAALEVVEVLPEGAARTRTEAELLLSLGVGLTSSDGYGSREVGEVFGRARALCRGLDAAADLFPVLHGLYRFYYVRDELDAAMGLADQMLAIARGHKLPVLLTEAHRAAGNILFARGQFNQAEAHLADAMSHYDPVAHAAHRYIYTLDPMLGAGSVRAVNTWCRGDRAGGARASAELLVVATERGHPFGLAWTLGFAGIMDALQDDLPRLRQTAERLMDIAERHAFPMWHLNGLMILGWWLHRSGTDRARGVRLMEEGLAGWARIGQVSFRAFYVSLLARAHLQDGSLDAARAELDATLNLLVPLGDVWWVPELRRLRAQCDAAVLAPVD